MAKSRIEKAKELIDEDVLNSFIKEDPTKRNKYLFWMATQKKNGHLNEDIVGTIKSFHRRNKSLKFQDIYKYDDLKALENEILELNPSKSERKDIGNLKESKDYICLIDKKPIKFYAVLSYRGMKNLGKNTKWCIQASKSYWDSYSKDNIIFMLSCDSKTLIKERSSWKRIALLSGDYDKGYGYEENDSHIYWHGRASQNVIDEVSHHMEMIHKISQNNKKAAKRKVSNNNIKYFVFANEKRAAKKVKKGCELSSYIKKYKMYSLLLRSHNSELIKANKKDITNHLGVIKYETNYSEEFYNIFEKEIFISVDSLIESNLTHKRITQIFGKTVEKLSKEKFKKLINSCKYANTRKSLYKLRPSEWGSIDAKNINQITALALLKEHGDKALYKAYLHYGKKKISSYYYYGSYGRRGAGRENEITKHIKSMTINTVIAKTVANLPDCPKPLKTLLLNKDLSVKNANKIKAALKLIALSEGVDVKKLSKQSLQKYIGAKRIISHSKKK